MQIKEPRQQLDHMLRETRIHLISFSQMADTKANILLSISSVLLSISLTKVADPRFTGAITALVAFLLVTIFLALMTVIPNLRRKKHSVNDPTYSPLYFGDYVDIPYDEYAGHFADLMNDSDRTYEAMVKEIYYSGIYLEKNKYRYIRLGYIFFFAGLIATTLLFFIENFM